MSSLTCSLLVDAQESWTQNYNISLCTSGGDSFITKIHHCGQLPPGWLPLPRDPLEKIKRDPREDMLNQIIYSKSDDEEENAKKKKNHKKKKQKNK